MKLSVITIVVRSSSHQIDEDGDKEGGGEVGEVDRVVVRTQEEEGGG